MGTEASAAPLFVAPFLSFDAAGFPASVAIGDLNGDGKPDLVTASHGANEVSVLLGNGDGTFGPKTDFGIWPGAGAVAIGDLNGDGKPDMAVTSGSNTVSVLLNAGPGTTDVAPAPTTVPGTAELLAPRPNPSRGASEIRWVVSSACRLDLAIFDLAGRRVRLLLAGARSEPGQHGVSWDGRDDTGARVREGVYLVQLRAAARLDTRKFIVFH